MFKISSRNSGKQKEPPDSRHSRETYRLRPRRGGPTYYLPSLSSGSECGRRGRTRSPG